MKWISDWNCLSERVREEVAQNHVGICAVRNEGAFHQSPRRGIGNGV